MSRRTLPIVRNLLSARFPTRSITYMPSPGDGSPRPVTLIPGDGVGPLVTDAVEQVMEAMHAPVYFEKYDVRGDMKNVPPEVLESIKKNKVCLKGGLRTPVGGGVSSLNMILRKELDLYASLVHCFNLPGLPTRHDNVDIVVIRENTEGEYAGLEHEVIPGVVESLKVSMSLAFVCVCLCWLCATFQLWMVEYIFWGSVRLINIHLANGTHGIIMKLEDLIFSL